MAEEIGREAGVGPPKLDSPGVGRELPVLHADEPMLARRSVKPMGNIRDIVRRVERNHERKQLVFRCAQNRRDEE